MTFSAVNSSDVLFPLRLGFACTARVPLASVLIEDVTAVSAGVPGATYTVSATDPVNIRWARCPSDASLRRVLGHLDDRSAAAWRDATSRSAYVVTSDIAANGTYVVVHVVVVVAVPPSDVAAAGSNIASIPAVSAVLAALSPLLPLNSTSAASGTFGSFLGSVAAAAGVNASLLSIGSTRVPTVASIASAGTAGGQGSSAAPNSSLGAGAIAGIAIALIGTCLGGIVLVFCFTSGRTKNGASDLHKSPASSTAIAIAPHDTLPIQSNPLRTSGIAVLEGTRPKSDSNAPDSAGDRAQHRKQPEPGQRSVTSLAAVSNPMFEARELRSTSTAVSSAADTTESVAARSSSPLTRVHPSTEPGRPALGSSAVLESGAAGRRKQHDASLDAYTNPVSRALVGAVAQQQVPRRCNDVRGGQPSADPLHSTKPLQHARQHDAAVGEATAQSDEKMAEPGPQLPRLRREALLATAAPESETCAEAPLPRQQEVALSAGESAAVAHQPQLPRQRAPRSSRTSAQRPGGASRASRVVAPVADPAFTADDTRPDVSETSPHPSS